MGQTDLDAEPADELFTGESGFWQFWWDLIDDRDHETLGPLTMDIVVPDDGTFEVRSWLAESNPEVLAHVLGGRLITGRVIVPPQSLKSIAEPMLDLATDSGFAVRMLSTPARFTLYDESIAVIGQPPGTGGPWSEERPEPYRAIRKADTVDPLCHFFELLWRSAAPFREHRSDQDAILGLLTRGFTDARIAQSLNLSPRTVSRRVSEVMAAYGAGSRFELGMIYGRYRPDE